MIIQLIHSIDAPHMRYSDHPAGCINQSEVRVLPAGCMSQSEVSTLPVGCTDDYSTHPVY